MTGLILAQLGQGLLRDHLPQLLQGGILGELLPIQHHLAHLRQCLQRVTLGLEPALDLVVAHTVAEDVDLRAPFASRAVLVNASLTI